MNESNFCKIKLLLFWGICLFLFPFCVSNAESKSGESSKNLAIVSDSYITFMDGSNYIGSYCGGDLNYFDIRKNDNGNYEVKVKEKTAKIKGTAISESVTCTYLRNLNKNLFNGYVTYVFHYYASADSNSSSLNKDIVVHMYYGRSDNSYDIINGTSLNGNVARLYNFKVNSGGNYVNLDCSNGGKTCVAKLRDNLDFSSSIRTVNLEFDYNNFIDMPGHAKVVIKIHSDKTIYANKRNLGVCKFGDGWNKTNISTDTYSYNYNGSAIRFPSCDASKSANPLYKFVGWSNNDYLTNATDSCNDSIIAADVDFYPNLDDDPFYSTCYVKSGVGLSVGSKGNLKDEDLKNWSKKNNIYYKLSDGRVVLPEPKPVEGYTFLGWKISNDSDLKKAGEEVDSNGTIYYAYFEKEGTSYENDDVIKTLYVGNVTLYKLSGVTFESGSCSSSNPSKVTVTSTLSGACYLIAKAPTDIADYVTITAKDASDNTYQIKAQVVSATGSSELELGKNIFTVKLPSFQDMIGVNGTNNSNSTNTVSATIANGLTCRKYFVYRDRTKETSDDFTNTISGTGESNSINFIAESQCDRNVVYSALCLDPGRLGPDKGGSGGKYYYTSRDLHPSNDNNNQAKFDKGIASILSYLTTNKDSIGNFSDTDNDSRIAANLAARMMAIHYGESTSNDNATFPGSYAAYKKLTDGWYKTNRTNCSGLDSWNWLKPGVLTKLCAMLMNEKTYQLKTISEDVTNETKEGSFEDNVLNVTGAISLPNGATVLDKNISLQCPSNASCEWKEKSVSSGTINYSVTVTLEDDEESRIDGDCSKETGLCIKLVYTPSASNIPISGAMLLEPAGSSNLQRLIVFAPGDAQVSVPIYTKGVTKDVCRKIEESDFYKLDCCNYITDHTSELYKKYCKNDCLYSDFSLVCTVDDLGRGNVRDYYSISEATNATVDKPKVNGCVIDTVHKITDTKNFKDNYTDEAGNEYTVEAYKNNRYCRVSCFEAWDFSMAGFKNFVGENAVVAGSAFQLNEDIYLSGKRTCVSSFTDYDQYLTDVSKESESMRKNFNDFSERGVIYTDLQTNGAKFKNSKDAAQWTVYNYNGKLSHHDKTDTAVCGYEGPYSDTRSSSSGYPADFCSGDYFDCSCSTSSSKSECNCTGSGAKRKCSTCTTYTKTCSWKTYRGECWRVESDASLKCNRFELYSNNKAYDYYASAGTPHQASASTSASQGFTGEVMTLSDDYVGSQSGVGGIFYQYPANGRCESDPGLTGSQTVNDKTMYATLLSRTQYKGSNLKSSMNDFAKKVNESLVTIQNYANEFSACQNFNILNTNDIRGKNYENNRVWYSYWGGHTGYNDDGQFDYFDGKSYVVKNSTLLKSLSANIVKIPNAFHPQTAYKYEEKDFMAILNRNKSNVLEVNRDYNDGKYDKVNDDVLKGTCVAYTNSDGKVLDICNNKFELKIYKGQEENGVVKPWNTTVGEAYGGNIYETDTNSSNDSTFLLCAATDYSEGRKKGDTNKGECVSAQFYYYKANYIKQTIQNSAYFSNKDYWWIKQNTGAKDHEESRVDAAKAYHDAEGGKGWSKLGTNHNVFPVGMTTRGSIYQYVYAFNDIGMYSNGKLGRIMSIDENSLLGFYTHTCFYEVKEKFCSCCTVPYESTIEEETRIVTSEKIVYVEGKEYNYPDNTKITHDGIMALYPSPVSLNDLDSGTGRKLAANWSSDSNYYFGGVNYSTDKGDKLANSIEDKGETVYDETPEYSYTLDPSALAKLRTKDREYGVSVEKIDTFYELPLDDSQVDTNENPLLTFHVNSALSVDFENYITMDYRDSVLTNVKSMNKSCYVTSSNVEDARDLVKKCRFVYYLDTNKNGPSIRLAFK